MGVLVRRDPRNPAHWYVRINWGKRRKSVAFSSEKAARVAAIKIEAGLKLGALALDTVGQPEPRHTFATLAEEWLARYTEMGKGRETTQENHESFARLHLLPYFGDMDVKMITWQIVEDFIAEKRSAKGSVRHQGKSLADSSLRTGLQTLRQILQRGVKRGLLPANPMALAEWRPQRTADHIDPFMAAELRAILEAAYSVQPEFGVFVELWARTGMRLGEVMSLMHAAVDPGQGTALVQRTWSRRRLGPVKTGQGRLVALCHPVCEDTAAWRPGSTPESHRLLARLRAMPSLNPERFLFGGERPWALAFVYASWRRCLKRAGLRYRNPEQLRHTWASAMLARNAPLTYVQAQGGWRSASVLLRVYARWLPQVDARSAQAPAEGRQNIGEISNGL